MKDWFTIDKTDDTTYIISEYRHWEETHIVYEAEKTETGKTQRIKIIYNCVGAVTIPSTLTVQARTKIVAAA